MPKESSNMSNIEQHCAESTLIYSKRTRTLEVIHTLREIIDTVRENVDAEENTVKNGNYDHEKNDSEIPTSPNRNTLWSNNTYTKDVDLDKADRSSWRSISTQTELDIPSYRKIDAEKDQDLTEILKLTRSVATQTSPSYNRNVVEIGCSTYNVVCNDVEVSCDIIGTNLKTEVNPITIEDKSMSDVPSSVKHIGINVESRDTNENEKLSFRECKKTLNTEMSLKLENCDNMEVPAKTTNDASEEAEKIMHEKVCEISLQSPKNFDDKTNTDIDKHQEFAKYSNNHGASNTSVNNIFLGKSRLSICNYDASCSFEEVAECLENDEVTSEPKVENIPSDVIATFELAAERARNLHEAIIIYRKNLLSRESGKRNEETVDDCNEMSKYHQHYLEKCASFVNRENEYNIRNEKIKSEYEAMCDRSTFTHSAKDDTGHSTCSFSSSSDQISESEYLRLLKDFETDREEENFLSGREQAVTRSNLNERFELKDVKSLIRLVQEKSLMQRLEEEYALELLQSERNDESFEMEKNDKIFALPAAVKETSLILHENLLPLICCIVCTVVFWCLQFSFRCDLTK